MPSEQAPDLAACAREPIHVPGTIQPHGVLLVVDPATDRIAQGAGDAARLLGVEGLLAGKTAHAVFGISLADLLRQSGMTLAGEPAYIGTLSPGDGRGELTLTAHFVQGLAVIEAFPAGPSASAAGTLASIRSITERIGGATSVLEACQIAASEVARITGYDRIMVYRFLPDGSGSVIAEVKDSDLPPFLNHRYPESDIPRQARELYRRSSIRLIPDVAYRPAPLVPPQPVLDMSHCSLRSVSSVHIQYLRNMKVGASMSVSILPRGALWGLIACHNRTPQLLSYEVQEACRHVGQILSQLIAARDDRDAERIAHKLAAARDKVIRTLAEANEADAVFDLCPTLQTIAESDGTAVVGPDQAVTAGHAPDESQVRQLAAWLDPGLADTGFFVTDHLSEAVPQAAAFAARASGLLAVRLPGEDPIVFMWFRVEQLQEVLWAGNPHKPLAPGSRPGTLNPRTSFAIWRETVSGRSRPWHAADIDSARAFSPAAAFLLQQQKVRHLNELLGEANRQLTALASTDGLTGIPNRRAFDERLHEEWQRARRSGRPLALIVLDLDFFKQYNDHFGHPTGDECLRKIAGLLDERRRTTDFAARVGGEEFAILLSDTDSVGASVLAETIRSRIEQLNIDHPKSSSGLITASLGVACLIPRGGQTPHELMKMADRALYEAKSQGRNCVVHL